MIATFLTFGVAIPIFVTAFSIAATLEYAGKKKGARGLFGWMFRLPYFDKDRYLFAYLIAGLLIFILGGLTGLVNASYSLNNTIHNTAWMPGHFHMTVAGPVFLAIIGMSIYLLSHLTGKKIIFPRLNVIIPYLWIFGMLFFSTGLSWGGLIGEPRRTAMGMSYLNPDSPLYQPQWVITTTLTAVGGVIMTIAGGMFIILFIGTALSRKSEEAVLTLPVSEALHDEPQVGWLNNMRPWIIVMLFLIIMVYVPAIRESLKNTGPGAPPYDPANPAPVAQSK
jgi:cytochrome c oxidase subunit 1